MQAVIGDQDVERIGRGIRNLDQQAASRGQRRRQTPQIGQWINQMLEAMDHRHQIPTRRDGKRTRDQRIRGQRIRGQRIRGQQAPEAG